MSLVGWTGQNLSLWASSRITARCPPSLPTCCCSFTPMVVIGISARDAFAVILRMAKYPEKREDLMEWVLLCACLITLALPGDGRHSSRSWRRGSRCRGCWWSGGRRYCGSELGAALRAVMLMLIKASTRLTEILQFLQKFMKGNILQFVKAIKSGNTASPFCRR